MQYAHYCESASEIWFVHEGTCRWWGKLLPQSFVELMHVSELRCSVYYIWLWQWRIYHLCISWNLVFSDITYNDLCISIHFLFQFTENSVHSSCEFDIKTCYNSCFSCHFSLDWLKITQTMYLELSAYFIVLICHGAVFLKVLYASHVYYTLCLSGIYIL